MTTKKKLKKELESLQEDYKSLKLRNWQLQKEYFELKEKFEGIDVYENAVKNLQKRIASLIAQNKNLKYRLNIIYKEEKQNEKEI